MARITVVEESEATGPVKVAYDAMQLGNCGQVCM